MPAENSQFAKYLAVTARDVRWQIYCTTAGCYKVPPGASYPVDPGAHPPKYLFNWEMGRIYDEYALVYITRGNGLFKTEGNRTFPVTPGSLLMLFPEVWHWYSPDQETGWDEYWVGFKGEYPKALVDNGFFSPDTSRSSAPSSGTCWRTSPASPRSSGLIRPTNASCRRPSSSWQTTLRPTSTSAGSPGRSAWATPGSGSCSRRRPATRRPSGINP
jgi:hypothetical protein